VRGLSGPVERVASPLGCAWPHGSGARGLSGLGSAGPPNGRARGISAGGRVASQAVERVATRVRWSAWPHRWGARGLSAGKGYQQGTPEYSKPWGRRVGPAPRFHPEAEVDEPVMICAIRKRAPPAVGCARQVPPVPGTTSPPSSPPAIRRRCTVHRAGPILGVGLMLRWRTTVEAMHIMLKRCTMQTLRGSPLPNT